MQEYKKDAAQVYSIQKDAAVGADLVKEQTLIMLASLTLYTTTRMGFRIIRQKLLIDD